MEDIIVSGGHRLNGIINVQGSKNSVLPIMAASVLAVGITVIKNYPHISDVYDMGEILTCIGCEVIYKEEELVIDSSNASVYEIDSDAAKNIRASIILMGPLLSRFKSVKIPLPGGCDIGKRPIDIHLNGLKRLNASWEIYDGYVHVNCQKLVGNDICLSYPSVGATENILIASVMASGTTDIYNVAVEPEITDLCNYLIGAGASIQGIGTSHLSIEGVKSLHESEYVVKADRIVTGTYLCACIACGGELTLRGSCISDTFGYTDILCGMGAELKECRDGITIKVSRRPDAINYIETKPYPGFSTDMQQIVMGVLAKASGKSIICEKIFENRLNVAKQLNKMGADIVISDDRALISGVESLKGCTVTAKDLRGAAALVIAGLSAEGTTVIEDCFYINRGYGSIVEELSELGAEIKWKEPQRKNTNQ